MTKNINQLYNYYRSTTGVRIDSRKVKANNLFIAIKGERFDGNAFAEQAIQNGASYAFIDDPAYQKDERYILVENGLTTLQDLARHHRKQLDTAIIAITGSNGKTTTKELLKSVLSTTYKTQATQGNLNNHIGVPLTLLSIDTDTDMAIVEMGANHPNEINFLCSIALPNFGLITNIGKAHLEGFGSLDGVAKAKGELFDFLEAAGGRAFINMNDKRLLDKGYYIQKTMTYGSSRRAGICGKLIPSTNECIQIDWQPKKPKKATDTIITHQIQTNLIGSYNLDNILAAIAVGTFFKVKPTAINNAIESYSPTNNRSQIVTKATNTFILDAYNANPSSMKAALTNLNQLESDQQKVVIIGDMLELGSYSQTEHQNVIDFLTTMSLNQVILVGKLFGQTQYPSNFLHFTTSNLAKDWYIQQNFTHTLFLIKGSRGIALEKIIQ